MFKNFNQLISKLKNNDQVVGIVRYGSRRSDDMSSGGDFDLFVILKGQSREVESLHFYVQGIPVDLGIRVWEDLELSAPLTMIDSALPEGEILYDETGQLREKISKLNDKWSKGSEGLTESEIAFERFSQKHVLDKVKGRLERRPVLCNLLLTTNIYWLIRNYFRIRGLDYPGEKSALKIIKQEELEFYEGINDFYAADDLQSKVKICEELTEIVLAPVGGPWREDEIIAFGREEDTENVLEKGEKLFSRLLKEN